MTGVWFCLLMAATYAAPNMAPRTRDLATVAYLVIASVLAVLEVVKFVVAP